jgi:hypothetical protein
VGTRTPRQPAVVQRRGHDRPAGLLGRDPGRLSTPAGTSTDGARFCSLPDPSDDFGTATSGAVTSSATGRVRLRNRRPVPAGGRVEQGGQDGLPLGSGSASGGTPARISCWRCWRVSPTRCPVPPRWCRPAAAACSPPLTTRSGRRPARARETPAAPGRWSRCCCCTASSRPRRRRRWHHRRAVGRVDQPERRRRGSTQGGAGPRRDRAGGNTDRTSPGRAGSEPDAAATRRGHHPAGRLPAAALGRGIRRVADPPTTGGRRWRRHPVSPGRRGVTEQAADAGIEQACRLLRLPMVPRCHLTASRSQGREMCPGAQP